MGIDERLFKEFEADLEAYLKQNMEDLVESKKLSKKYILKELAKNGLKWISNKLPIDFYKISEERKKEYEEKIQKIVNNVYLKNIDERTKKINLRTKRTYKKAKSIVKNKLANRKS
jgi:hypothetical protein